MKEEKFSHKIINRIRLECPVKGNILNQVKKILLGTDIHIDETTRVSTAKTKAVYDIVIFAKNEPQCASAIESLKTLKKVKVLFIHDEILELHKGGKIGVVPKVRLETIKDLRMVYTPGVAQVCTHILHHPESAREYTSIGNSVCIATNGSAVLGLGNIGVLAGMPVMEGKSVIVQKMAGVNCIPLLIDSDEPATIVNVLQRLAKTFSLIMIEDIAAPVCFEVEDTLQSLVPIPVFHDDQHGTAIVVLAALINVIKSTKKKIQSIKIVINGAGAAGIATARLLLSYGFKNIVICDKAGALFIKREQDMNPYKKSIAEITNPDQLQGPLTEIIKNADVFIGLSGPNVVTKEMVQSMNKKAVVLPLANPIPEIWPENAIKAGAYIAIDGRIINNALAFPGIIRGALDAQANQVTKAMKFKAAETIAAYAAKNQIVPDFMDLRLHQAVAAAVKKAAHNPKV